MWSWILLPFSPIDYPAERNYDVGNQELLAVLALQEWRHWLEGAVHPFIVWTDHKNLSYLRSARRLNPCQARWALFLSRFNFTLTYQPGPKNVKNSFSHQFTPTNTDEAATDPFLHTSRVVGAIQWRVEQEVLEALQQYPSTGLTLCSPTGKTLSTPVGAFF